MKQETRQENVGGTGKGKDGSEEPTHTLSLPAIASWVWNDNYLLLKKAFKVQMVT